MKKEEERWSDRGIEVSLGVSKGRHHLQQSLSHPHVV